MFQETQNWKKDGIAGEIGWRLFRAENGGEATVAVKRRHLGRLRQSRESLRWDMVALGSILFLELNLRTTWVGLFGLLAVVVEGYAQSRAVCWSGNATEQRHWVAALERGETV